MDKQMKKETMLGAVIFIGWVGGWGSLIFAAFQIDPIAGFAAIGSGMLATTMIVGMNA